MKLDANACWQELLLTHSFYFLYDNWPLLTPFLQNIQLEKGNSACTANYLKGLSLKAKYFDRNGSRGSVLSKLKALPISPCDIHSQA